MLTDVLPARYRKAAYAVYGLIGVVLGAIQVAYLNIAGQPQWLTVALVVYGFLGTAFGATAASNITAGRGLSDAERAQLADLFDKRAAAAAAVMENVKRQVYGEQAVAGPTPSAEHYDPITEGWTTPATPTKKPAAKKAAAKKKPAKKAAPKPPVG